MEQSERSHRAVPGRKLPSTTAPVSYSYPGTTFESVENYSSATASIMAAVVRLSRPRCMPEEFRDIERLQTI